MTNYPNLTLQVSSNGTAVNQGGTVYIDPTPTMPPLQATIVSSDGTQVTGSSTYQLKVSFNQMGRPGVAGPITERWPYATASNPASATWSVDYTTNPYITVFGGNAQLLWWYNGSAQTPFSFTILGTNPSQSTIDAAIPTSPYWFSRNWAIHETRESQFCQGSRTAIGKYCRNGGSQVDGLPLFGSPQGYGIFQIDPPTQTDDIWNWQTNISDGQKKLSQYPGSSFWLNQIAQWNAWNASNGQNQVKQPADIVEGVSASSCTFTFATSAGGASPGKHWFGDADLMQSLGGVDQGYYISLKGYSSPSGQLPQWWLHSQNSVNSNVVWEFCTCNSIVNCQVSGPNQVRLGPAPLNQ